MIALIRNKAHLTKQLFVRDILFIISLLRLSEEAGHEKQKEPKRTS